MTNDTEKWGKDEAKKLPARGDQPRGLGTKANLRDWSDYARTNSFSQAGSKAQSRLGFLDHHGQGTGAIRERSRLAATSEGL
jgi:hypothetical protein